MSFNFYDEQEIPEIIERLYITRSGRFLMLFEEGEDLGWQLLSTKQARS